MPAGFAKTPGAQQFQILRYQEEGRGQEKKKELSSGFNKIERQILCPEIAFTVEVFSVSISRNSTRKQGEGAGEVQL